MHLVPSRRIAKVERAVMVHAAACIVRTIHTDRPLVSSIIHVHHDRLLAGELMKQLIDECFYIKYAT
jgi:hypothetical protein